MIPEPITPTSLIWFGEFMRATLVAARLFANS
jgi:hypothetical protein